MADYLKVQTLGSILRSAFNIYFRYWRVVFGICALPVAPVYLLVFWVGMASENLVFSVIGDLVAMLVQVSTITVLTVAVAEICLGHEPSIERAYQRVFAAPGRIFGTVALWLLMLLLSFFPSLVLASRYLVTQQVPILVGLGAIALAFPALVLTIRYLFVQQVTVLEGLGGGAAIRRAGNLGRGFYLRNLGVCIVFALIVKAIGVLTLFALWLFSVFGPNINFAIYFWTAVGIVVNLLIAPIPLLGVVLLYIDVRTRKEGYNNAQLLEDLKLPASMATFAHKRLVLIGLAVGAFLVLAGAAGLAVLQSRGFSDENVKEGDKDYPARNSSPQRFVLVYGTIDSSLDLTFKVAWYATAKECQYYLPIPTKPPISSDMMAPGIPR